MIHPTAIIHPKAKVSESVTVGPHVVIDEHVEIGPDCVIGPHAYLTGHTVIGARNRFHAGAVIGDAPQDLKYRGEPSRLRVGDSNTFREYLTVHRSCTMDEDTVIGSNNLLMAHCHVAHNCTLRNGIILANGALLAGHVTVHDRAIISGNCLVHQFVTIGTLSMMQGGAAISKDLPPYTIAREYNGIAGLNVIGLRRAGIASADRLELRKAYKALFRSDKNISAALADAKEAFTNPVAKTLIDFVATSKRGVCADLGSRFGRTDTDADSEEE
jgi:UDP-N-acetylglucosamine acyltransferase